MGKLIIDAHSHLWLHQNTMVDGKRILSLKNGRSIFMDEEVQMLPPFMIDGRNTAEVFLTGIRLQNHWWRLANVLPPIVGRRAMPSNGWPCSTR